jgi:hypothetical protein
MSTVLWANALVNGKVQSDESDKHALYKHSKKLDNLTKENGVVSFSSVQDFTDMRINLSEEDLPDGVESTDELMALDGVWVSGEQSVDMIERLISIIQNKKIKFGLLRDDSQEILRELEESLTTAKKAKSQNGKFNFSVVM